MECIAAVEFRKQIPAAQPRGAGPTIKLKKASKVTIKVYEDGLTGWTIHGKGRVSSKFAFDVTGGYVQVNYDSTGFVEPSNQLNGNFYTCAQDKDKMNTLTKKSTGKEVMKTYCDAQAPKPLGGGNSCEEWDIYESYGTKGGTVTIHAAGDGAGKPVGEHHGSGGVFKWEGTASGGTLTLGGDKIPYDHSKGVNLSQVGKKKGWRTHSSLWTGWTKENQGGSMNNPNLAKSVFKVRGFKGKWTWIAGTKPPKCDANGKVPRGKTADEKSTEAPSATPAPETAAEPTAAATPAPSTQPTTLPPSQDDSSCAEAAGKAAGNWSLISNYCGN
eukprot:g7119.t1